MDNAVFSYKNFFSNLGIYTDLFDSYQYPWEVLAQIDAFISRFKESDIFSEYQQIEDRIFIGRNVVIDDTARIAGAAIIGHDSSIGHAAFLRGGVLLGDNVHVGHATEVKHSVILSGAALAHLNYIGDSVVGSDTNISGGATLANWRFDKKDIQIKNGEGRIDTRLEKMGSIIGDGSFVGVSAVINPGTILAKGSLVYPLVSVRGAHLQPKTFKS